jgi:hypothetical protein
MSDGTRISKRNIDRLVHQAKGEVLADQVEEYGYNFCTVCKQNDCLPVTCMHLVSVDRCQKEGRAELAWDKTNIVPAGQPCHAKYDGNNIGGNK